MTVINLRVTPAEMNAIEVGLDTIIEQLMHPYHKDNRQKLIMALRLRKLSSALWKIVIWKIVIWKIVI